MSGYRHHSYAGAGAGPELFARDYPGEGPALLMMHGLTRNSADFEPLAERLAGRYRLVVPDQRGRGLSAADPDPGNYRPEVYAQDMFALLYSLGIARAALIGTSMALTISNIPFAGPIAAVRIRSNGSTGTTCTRFCGGSRATRFGSWTARTRSSRRSLPRASPPTRSALALSAIRCCGVKAASRCCSPPAAEGGRGPLAE